MEALWFARPDRCRKRQATPKIHWIKFATPDPPQVT